MRSFRDEAACLLNVSTDIICACDGSHEAGLRDDSCKTPGSRVCHFRKRHSFDTCQHVQLGRPLETLEGLDDVVGPEQT